MKVVREADHTDGGRDKENFEEDPEGLKVGIHIQNLHKVTNPSAISFLFLHQWVAFIS